MKNNTLNINEQIISLREQGFMLKEIAEQLYVGYDKVRYVVNKNGMKDFKYDKICLVCQSNFKTSNPHAKYCRDACRQTFNRNNKGKGRNCCWCNKEFRSKNVRKYCSEECKLDHFQNIRTKKKLARRIVKAIDPRRQKKCESCGNTFYAKNIGRRFCSGYCLGRSHYIPRRHHHKCRECGKGYVDNQSNSAGCSDRCKRRYHNRANEIRKRYTLSSDGKINWDITLDKLITRDNGVCYICKNKIEMNDYHIDHKGYHISGDYYPSIDHVFPISKGGAHTWDNIKLAHRICNTFKANKVNDQNKNKQLPLF